LDDACRREGEYGDRKDCDEAKDSHDYRYARRPDFLTVAVRIVRDSAYPFAMEATAAQIPVVSRQRSLLDRIDFQALAVWLLGFVLVVYLALNGGGFDPIVRNQLGIAVWWGVLLGLAVGALPLNRLRYGSWIALGLLAAYVAWVALSCIWTDTTGRTVEDLGRVITYLGVFALALSIRGSKGARRMVAALGAGIAVVAFVALLSRLHPAWFPDARETVEFLKSERNRLAYPLGYWNGVASLIAIGLPLVLYIACSARQIVTQTLAAAALPAMSLTIYLTFSRGGTLAAIVALALFLALAHDRLSKAATLLTAGVGAAILIAGVHQRDALDAGLGNSQAHHQGNEMLAMTLVVCAGVGLVQAGLALALRHGQRPAWTKPSRRASLALASGVLVTLVIFAIGAGMPGKMSHAWGEFKESKGPAHGVARFESFSSNGRWPYWQSALKEGKAKPLAGTGSGSFESWWAQHDGTTGGFVQDAHSLYLETLGELGIVGLVLIVSFLGWVLVAGGRRYLRAARRRRTQLAAVLAGCAAFCLGAAYDWLWELAVIPIAFLLLASVLVSAGERPRRAPFPFAARASGIVIALAAMVAIAIPLSSSSSLQKSQVEARAGNLSRALREASDAQRVEPFAAAPLLQQALVLEAQGDLRAAEAAAEAAVHREPHEWRAWVVLSRIHAERGRPRASLASYRRARSLNPRSSLF
jgi:O-antigen ligase